MCLDMFNRRLAMHIMAYVAHVAMHIFYFSVSSINASREMGVHCCTAKPEKTKIVVG